MDFDDLARGADASSESRHDVRWILDNAETLAKRFEDYDHDPADERDPKDVTTGSRPTAEQDTVD